MWRTWANHGYSGYSFIILAVVGAVVTLWIWHSHRPHIREKSDRKYLNEARYRKTVQRTAVIALIAGGLAVTLSPTQVQGIASRLIGDMRRVGPNACTDVTSYFRGEHPPAEEDKDKQPEDVKIGFSPSHTSPGRIDALVSAYFPSAYRASQPNTEPSDDTEGSVEGVESDTQLLLVGITGIYGEENEYHFRLPPPDEKEILEQNQMQPDSRELNTGTCTTWYALRTMTSSSNPSASMSFENLWGDHDYCVHVAVADNWEKMLEEPVFAEEHCARSTWKSIWGWMSSP